MSKSETASSDTEISFSNVLEASNEESSDEMAHGMTTTSKSTEKVVIAKRIMTTSADHGVDIEEETMNHDIEKICTAISKFAQCEVTNVDDAIAKIDGLFDAVSSKAETNIMSIDDLLSFIDDLIKRDHESKTLIERTEKENQRLANLLDEARVKDLELENEQLRRKLSQDSSSSTEIISRLNDAKDDVDTQIKLAQYESHIAELELEIKELKSRERTQMDKTITETKTEKGFDNIDAIEKAIDMFELFSNTQTDVIQLQSSQKDALAAAVDKLTACLTAAESVIKELSEEREELISQVEATEKEFEEQRQRNADRLQTLSERVCELLPPEITPMVGQIDEQIVKAVRDLVDKIESDTGSKSSQRDKREMALLAQLDKAVCFARAFATSKLELDRSTFSEFERSRMITEIARIQNFIGSEALELPHSASLFRDDTPEEQLKILNDFISRDAVFTTPIREIYALFALVVDVNAILFKKNKELSERYGSKLAHLEEVNGELQKTVDANNEKLECCAVLLREITGDEEQDLVALAYNVVKEFNQLATDSKENAKSIQSLTTTLDHLEGKQGKPKMSKVKAKLQKYKELLIAERQEREELAEEAKKKINEVIAQLKESEARWAECDVEKISTKIRAYKACCKKQARVVNRLEDENKKLKEENAVVKSENEKLVSANKRLEEQITEAKTELSSQTEKYLRLKSKTEEMGRENSAIIQSIREKNEEVQRRYGKRMEELETMVEKKNEELVRAVSERNESKAMLVEVKAEAAKLRLSEKMLTIKLNRLSEQAQLQTQTLEGRMSAKLASLKAEYDSKIKELQSEIQKSTDTLVDVIEDTFGVHMRAEAKASLESTMYELSDLLAQNFVKDSLDTRKNLNMKDNESLSMIIDGYNYQIAERDQKIQDLQEAFAKQKKKASDFESRYKEMDDIVREYHEWMQWGTSLFLVLKNVSPPSPDLMRFDLEESVLASLGHRDIMRRLETLRTEKKFLLSRNGPLARVRSTRSQPTLRAMIAVSVCLKRLLTFNRSL